MERKFLEELGIGKELVDKVMEEHGKSIQAEQDKTASKDAELAAMVKANGELEAALKNLDGEKPEDVEQALADLRAQHDTEISKIRRDNALNLALVKSKAKRPEAVRALLNMDAIKLDGEVLIGLENQLKELKESDAYLFEDENAIEKRKDSGTEHGDSPDPDKDAKIEAAIREGAGLLSKESK